MAIPSRKIIISSEIDDALAKEVITQLVEIDDYDATQEESLKNHSREPIEMFINSVGGSASAGMAIIDTMDLIGTPIMTLGLGTICSMALPILLAGDYRVTGENTEFMYHGVSYGRFTDIENNRRIMSRIEDIQKAYDNYILKNTKFEKEFLNKVVEQRRDYFFNAQEALEKGVVHEILTKTREVELKIPKQEEVVEEVKEEKQA